MPKLLSRKFMEKKAVHIVCKYYLAFNYKVKCTFTMNISHNYHVNNIVMSGKMCNCVHILFISLYIKLLGYLGQ